MRKSISESLKFVLDRGWKSSFLLALLLLVSFVSLAPARAEAQSADTWKSVAIIGGSTAAGAYIGHKIGGRNGAYVGAAVGAGAGYAIDRKRRQNEYNNGYYGNNGYYRNDPYYGNGGYYGGPANQYPYGNGYQQTSQYSNGRRCSSRR